jgi:hypothetical protein
MILNDDPLNYKSFYTKSSSVVIEEPQLASKSRTITRAKLLTEQENKQKLNLSG